MSGMTLLNTLEESLDLKEEIKLIVEGGAYGHMAHPFDDNELKFADLKNIIRLGLSGGLNREDNVTEKTDGQHLMITYRDGKVVAARNKGQVKIVVKTHLILMLLLKNLVVVVILEMLLFLQ